MNTVDYMIPPQKTTLAEKLKKNEDGVPNWIIQNYNYFAYDFYSRNKRNKEIEKLLRLAEGELTLEDYQYILNPYDIDSGEICEPSVPLKGKLRDYNILLPIIHRLMGERRIQPNIATVFAVNSEVVSQYKEILNEQYKAALIGQLLIKLKEKGLNVEAPENQIHLKEVEELALDTWLQEFAIDGQNALEYLTNNLKLLDKFQYLFYYWLVTGESVSYKSVINDEVHYEVIDPREVSFFEQSKMSSYGEDSFAAVRRQRWPLSQIFDFFKEEIDADETLRDRLIELREQNFETSRFGFDLGNITNETIDGYAIDIDHVVWKTFVKRGHLTYLDALNQVQQTVVDDTYKIDKSKGDISIEWVWEYEVWEIWALPQNAFSFGESSNSSCVLLKYGSLPCQRTLLNNNNYCKLPYNKAKFGYSNKPLSIAKIAEPYVILYNVMFLKLETALNRAKEKLLLFPLGLIPKKPGWNEQKFIEVIDEFKIVFFDEQSERALASLQAIKEIDMGLGTFANDMWNLLENIKFIFWDAIGYNPQRYGDIATSSGKSITERAVAQSSVATKELSVMFDKFLEVEQVALIDHSRFAWKKGKKANFQNSKNKLIFMELLPEKYTVTEYGVYVLSGEAEQSKIDFIKSNVLQPLAQNNANTELLFSAIDSNDLQSLKKIAKAADKLQKEYQQKVVEQEQQYQLQIEQLRSQTEQAKLEMRKYEVDKRADTEIEKALIMSDSFNAQLGDTDQDGIPESEEIVERYERRELAKNQFEEQKRKQQVSEELQREKLKLQRAKQTTQVNN